MNKSVYPHIIWRIDVQVLEVWAVIHGEELSRGQEAQPKIAAALCNVHIHDGLGALLAEPVHDLRHVPAYLEGVAVSALLGTGIRPAVKVAAAFTAVHIYSVPFEVCDPQLLIEPY